MTEAKDPRLDQAIQKLARDIAGVQGRISAMERVAQGRFSSVSNGSTVYYDSDGNPVVIVGQQPDGSWTTQDYNGPPLPAPSTPILEAGAGTLQITWDGLDKTGVPYSTSDFSHVEVHISTGPNFRPTDDNEIASFHARAGGSITLTLEEIEFFVKFTAVNTSLRESAASLEASAVPGVALTEAAIDAKLTTKNGMSFNNVTLGDPTPTGRVVGDVWFHPDDDYRADRWDGDSWEPFHFGSDAILDYAINQFKLANGSVGSSKLSVGAVTASAIAAHAIMATAIAANAIYASAIGAEQINATHLGVGIVTAVAIQAGAVQATAIAADAIDGKTITGAIFRTAASGARTELRGEGLLQYDTAGNLLIRISSDGNRFTGSIEATDIIIRDALQMFGKNNKMGPGSVLTLTAASSAPAQPPALSWEYEQSRDLNSGTGLSGFFLTGGHLSADQSVYKGAGIYVGVGRIFDGAKYYQWPNVSPPGVDYSSSHKPWAYTRIANTVIGSLERAVTLGENNTAIDAYGYPEIWCYIWDDSGMNTSGSAAPVMKWGGKWNNFSWFKQYRVLRIIGSSGGNRNWFTILSIDTYTSPAIVKAEVYRWDSDAIPTLISETSIYLTMLTDEVLAGGVHGFAGSLGIDGLLSSTEVIVVQTNKRNLVWNQVTNGWASQTWPLTFTPQDRTIVSGDIITNTFGHFHSVNWAGGSTLKGFKYENNHKDISELWWGSYAWRGQASTTYLTSDSGRSSISYRPRARLRVSIPALPAPIAGVGAARDPAKDPYGWVYYLGHGSTDPTRTNRYLQPVQPTMPVGELLDRGISLSAYPTFSGTNPLINSTFDASSPAQIRSDATDTDGLPLLSFDGSGHAKVEDLTLGQGITTGFLGKGFRQLGYMQRAPHLLTGGGYKDANTSTGKVKWFSNMIVLGAGRSADTATNGYFEITYPPTGTSIPVHYSATRTSVVAAADGIPLLVWETLWYELPLGSNQTSLPGNFHITSYTQNESFIPPMNWVMVVTRVGYAGPEFEWGDGEVQPNYFLTTGGCNFTGGETTAASFVLPAGKWFVTGAGFSNWSMPSITSWNGIYIRQDGTLVNGTQQGYMVNTSQVPFSLSWVCGSSAPQTVALSGAPSHVATGTQLLTSVTLTAVLIR